jgi:Flp pilus assembly pilin Flp
MKQLTTLAKRFIKEEEGLETIEYAVMTALIVAGLVAALGALSGAIQGRFTAVQGTVDGIN